MVPVPPDPLPGRIIYQDPDHWIWCPSLVEADDGSWHLFASRWPKSIPFHPGWLLASEIIHCSGPSAAGPFGPAEVVLGKRGADFWDGRSAHNPRVLRDGAGWVLFYMGSTHPFPDPLAEESLTTADPRVIVARWRKRIGLATAADPRGPWTRPDRPLFEVRGGGCDGWLASNPAPLRHRDGSWIMSYKARASIAADGAYRPGPMRLVTARAPTAAGPWERERQTMVVIAGEGTVDVVVEDPYLWRSGRGYEMIAKDMNGALSGMHHALVHLHSVDGSNWRPADPVVISDRSLRWPDGQTEVLGSLERPSLLFDAAGQPTHLVAGGADGPGWFQDMTGSFVVLAELAGRFPAGCTRNPVASDPAGT